ncbi:HNH endonuclease [bacterium]|nr:HNH endonuclease [bacterium]
MTMYHTHHIIPRHMGGSDDPSNLVSLTIEEHAEAHHILYEKYHKEEDKLAWLALSGQASMTEIKRMRQKFGAKKGTETIRNNPHLCIKGGLAARNRKVGIHDPSKLYLKQEGGRKAIIKLLDFTRGSVWMNNGFKDSRVRPEKVDEYVQNGWSTGRLFSPSKVLNLSKIILDFLLSYRFSHNQKVFPKV